MFVRFLYLLTVIFSVSAHAQVPDWVNTISLSGDIRLRYDFLKKESPTPDRHRNQIRARLLTEAKPIDKVYVGVRIATGDASNVTTSNNTTMDNGGQDKPMWLDQAYIGWKPNDISKVIGGKMENPFYAVSRQLIFDADLAPEGVANTNSWSNGLFVNVGAFWIDERAAGSENGPSDAGLFAGQLGWSHEMGDVKLTIGASQYSFGGLKNKPVLNAGSTGKEGRGNSFATTGGKFYYDKNFDVSNGFFEVSTGSIALFVDYAQNTAASKQNKAYMAGLKYGKNKEAGDWLVIYSYRQTEKDAVVAGLKDSDFADGYNDSRGHLLTARYALAPKSYFEIYAGLADVEISTKAKRTDRYMVDLSIAF